MHRTPIAFLLGLACALPGLARAAEAEMCREGNLPEQSPLGVAKATGAPRIYLRSDMAPCPDESPACRGRAYVVPGDVLVTGTTQGRYVCVLFAGKTSTSTGYVLQTEIAAEPQPALPIGAWAGVCMTGMTASP